MIDPEKTLEAARAVEGAYRKEQADRDARARHDKAKHPEEAIAHERRERRRRLAAMAATLRDPEAIG